MFRSRYNLSIDNIAPCLTAYVYGDDLCDGAREHSDAQLATRGHGWREVVSNGAKNVIPRLFGEDDDIRPRLFSILLLFLKKAAPSLLLPLKL